MTKKPKQNEAMKWEEFIVDTKILFKETHEVISIQLLLSKCCLGLVFLNKAKMFNYDDAAFCSRLMHKTF